MIPRREFFAAFGHDGIGNIGTPMAITVTDLAGILMSAVQALERRTAEAVALKAELQALRTEMEAWRAAQPPDPRGPKTK